MAELHFLSSAFKKLTPAEELAIAEGKEVKRKRIPMRTMNARAEEVGSKVNYKRFWLQQQLCIVPAQAVFEPNWETGQHERLVINLASQEPFRLPGMWRTWKEDDGSNRQHLHALHPERKCAPPTEPVSLGYGKTWGGHFKTGALR